VFAVNYDRNPGHTRADDAVDRAPVARVHDVGRELATVTRDTPGQRAIARLPVLQMRLLEAFHFERRPVADIANSLGVSERAVEGRLRRARQNLRREVERDASSDGDIK